MFYKIVKWSLDLYFKIELRNKNFQYERGCVASVMYVIVKRVVKRSFVDGRVPC